jgi:hypothetical protein
MTAKEANHRVLSKLDLESIQEVLDSIKNHIDTCKNTSFIFNLEYRKELDKTQIKLLRSIGYKVYDEFLYDKGTHYYNISW